VVWLFLEIPSRSSSKEPVRIGSEERSVHEGAEQIGLEAEEKFGRFWRFRADRARRSQFGSELRRDSTVHGGAEQTELEGAETEQIGAKAD
jgi:hypothetical protein